MIKFMVYAVKNTNQKIKVHYSRSTFGNIDDVIVIDDDGYGYDLLELFKDYTGSLLTADNNTDSMTDYFCKTRIKIYPGHELYNAALHRYLQNKVRELKRITKNNKTEYYLQKLKDAELELMDFESNPKGKLPKLELVKAKLTITEKLASMPEPEINCFFVGAA